ncbi:hypothetical protein [Laribacter hongkongensis]|uniref:hypothetical protein n=1 Tax=Laribacter hongkongensis TaxID=168471 RepID=UPI001EFE914A|nr:hypothetical protein [Laribacter hongkongensis]MCG9100483.1 hypothetical protein [Laribacter hongkongensis]MCG9113282.1 hypothetical protein [Laribacter hongkongensis]
MQCNCLTDIEKKLTEKMAADLGVAVEVRSKNETFVLNENRMDVRHYSTFKITAQAKGYVRGKDIPVISSYCPFCGKKAISEPAAEDAQA